MFKRRPAVRSGGIAGIAAAACFIVGDILLLGRKADPERHSILRREDVDADIGSMFADSSAPLRAGALAGVLATPLRLFGARHFAYGMGKTGQAAMTALTLAQTQVSFIHGMFYPWGDTYRLAQHLTDKQQPEAAEQAIASGRGFGKAIAVSYAAYGGAVLYASATMAYQILRGRTRYPRWAAPLVSPAVPILVTIGVLKSPVVPNGLRYRLQGAAISIGDLIAWSASTALLWRR